MQPTPLQLLISEFTNRKGGTELTLFQRGLIIGASFNGTSQRELIKIISLPESTIRLTLKKAPLRDNQTSLPRSGQPKKYTARDERILLGCIRENPKWTWKQVMVDTGLPFSLSVHKRILRDYGISNWRSKRRPYLSPNHAKARLAFALKYLGYGDDE